MESVPVPIRRLGREGALKLLYELDMRATTELSDELLAEFWEQAQEDEVNLTAPRLVRRDWPKIQRFAEELVRGVLAQQPAIDAELALHASNWRLDRMAAVDRNLMRLAAYELMFRPEIPVAVTINEAVELAKAFGGPDSGRFVNAVLDQVTPTAKESLAAGPAEESPSTP